jgi:hypothetical protein
VRETTEAIVGAVTGTLASSRSLLLGRYDDHGRLQYTGRTTTTLTQTTSSTLAGRLTPARPGHPWTGWSFSAGWGTRQTLDVTLVRPELVVEVGVDIARDAAGRWRHPARLHRARPDLGVPKTVPKDAQPSGSQRRVDKGAGLSGKGDAKAFKNIMDEARSYTAKAKEHPYKIEEKPKATTGLSMENANAWTHSYAVGDTPPITFFVAPQWGSRPLELA